MLSFKAVMSLLFQAPKVKTSFTLYMYVLSEHSPYPLVAMPVDVSITKIPKTWDFLSSEMTMVNLSILP